MKKKQTIKKKNQAIEIHIYIHTVPPIPNPNGTGQFPPASSSPYVVTCQT